MSELHLQIATPHWPVKKVNDHVLINLSAVMSVLLESRQWAQASSVLWYVDDRPNLRNSLCKANNNWLHYRNLILTIPPIIYLFP